MKFPWFRRRRKPEIHILIEGKPLDKSINYRIERPEK